MNLFQLLMMNCKEATYFHEKKKEGKLSFAEMIGLNIHLLYCRVCKLFFLQIDELQKYVHQLSYSEKISSTLSTSAKEKMQKAFAEELKK